MDDLSSDALPLTDWHGVQPKSYCRMCWHDKTNELVCPEQDGFSYLEDRYLDWRGQLVKRARVAPPQGYHNLVSFIISYY